MAIYEIESDNITAVAEKRFDQLGLRERGDLQRLLRDQVEVIAPDTMVLAEEFGSWEDSRRRIDLTNTTQAIGAVLHHVEHDRTAGGLAPRKTLQRQRCDRRGDRAGHE